MNTREVESELRCSGGKRVSKIKNCFTSTCHNKKGTKFLTGYRWALFLIFQLFIALLVVQPNAWAGLSSFYVDANGDNVFNGDEEKLTITFGTDNVGEEGRTYTYEIKLDDNRVITTGPDADTGQTLTKNQTIEFTWDGKLKGQDKILDDGDYTIEVVLTIVGDLEQGEERTDTDEVTVTIDTKAPEVTISIDDDAFSPILYSLPIYYEINEDVSETWLEFQKAPGNANIGRRVPLSTTSGSHTFYWDGDDNARRPFFDGQYTLRIRVKDKGGNEAESGKTGNITIDAEEPRITSITLNDSIPLTNGKFVNTPIETINFTADDPEGTGVNLTGRDTEVLIRPVGGRNLNGAMTFGNKATFTLGDVLDTFEENGEYEVTAFISDNVGNLASSRVRFTFDNTAPILRSVATHSGEFSAGSGISGLTNYVEATLEDNTELNLTASTIRLKGPSGSDVLGQQTRPADDKIRWQLLAPLLTKDGIHDGQYTVEVVAADKAGNSTAPIQITFLFDNLAPELVSVRPTRDGEPFNILGDTAYYNLPLNQFVATFDDGEFGTGVLFSDADTISRIVFGTPNTDGSIDIISGRAFPDQNNNVLTYILDAPLLNRDGSQDGNYRFDVVAADTLGNNRTYNFHLIYDTQVPTLVSTVPAANESVKDLSEVVVKLNETTSGIDFVQSAFVLKRVMGENQVEVPVNISSNGTDTATLSLLQPIALDGSDDGTYVIEVTPTDRAGNVGSVARREFYLVSQAQPQVRLITPETGTVNSLGDITVQLVDYIGTGINFDSSTITVQNAQGQIVPQAEVVADEANNQLTWRTETTIPKGSADGRYTIYASFRDFSGLLFGRSFNVNLDTQFPAITSVQVGTDALNQLSLDSTTDVTESFSHISIEFDSTDVDFENTSVTLADPDGNDVTARKSPDGEALLTLNFQSLAKLGTYTLTVTPIDNIGNVSESPFIYNFNLDIAVPVVTSVLIDGQSGAIVYIKGDAGEIVATIADTTGIGIVVGQGESNIVVTTDSGLPVPGITTLNNENQLIWRPSVLPSDGSADGRYTVSVTPVDKAGRTGDVAYRAFIYDTQSPQITAAAPITLHQPISYMGDSLEQFQFSVEDVGPALLNLDDQTISFTKKSGEVVAGYITHDNNNQLFFTLPAPLPTDGSADGEYTLTVDLVDRAGNPSQVQHTIVYDSQAPQLASVSLNTETPLNPTPYQVTDISESISKITLNFVEMTRIDFDNTTITLMGPDGSLIPLTLENNGIDEITASFISLTQGELYTLSIIPQDIVGNAAQGEVPYPFRLKFEVPGITTVHANSVSASYELTAYELLEITDTISNITVTFTDASRVDFENTIVTLTGPNEQAVSVIQEDGDGSQFVVRFVTLIQSGLYTLSITPHDIIGNVAQSSMRYQFRLDITLPAVSSVLIDGQPGTNILLNVPDTEIVATFADASGVGLAFGDGKSTITVNNDQGLVVPGIISTNGSNQLTWTPAALPIDGSADGRYTVTITPVDKAGRMGTVVNRHFIYDTQGPRITSSSPIILHQPKSYIGGNLTSIELTVEDVGPSLLDLDAQTITLEKDGAKAVAGQVTHDGVNRLFFTPTTPLSTDGSADGEYTLTINLVDKAGNTNQATHKIYYDSQVPRISSVSLNTETPTDLTPYQVTDLSESVNQLTLNFIETTQVNFSATTVTLTGPNNTTIPLTLENNGVDQITASFVSLIQDGLYTLTVTPQDIAGNTAQGAVSYPFKLKFEIPGLTSVKANAADDSLQLVQHEIVETSEFINSLTLEFTDPIRVDFEATNVSLRGPDEQEIPVTLEENESSQLIVRFVPLEQRGLYTLSVTPQDKAGNIAQNAVSYQFRLKFDMPELASVKANTADAALDLTPYEIIELSKTVGGFTIEFVDGSRVDFENTRVVLTGPNEQQIPVTLEDDDDATLFVRFVSLEQSGLYTLSITPQDIDGTLAQNAVSYQFRLVFDMPELASVKVNTADAALDLTPYEIIELSEAVGGFTIKFADGSRVDFENTRVVLTGPNEQQIPVTLEDDDDATLFVRFVSLEQSGLYTLSITPQDIDGTLAQNAVSYQFRLKFEVPSLVSVTAHTDATSIALIRHKIVEISESIGSLTLKFTDAQRVDFENTSVTLTGPNGQEIPVTLEDDENMQLTVRFVPLTQSGIYKLSVTPQDTAGNVAQTAIQFQFRLDTTLPSVNAVLIDGKVGSVIYVRTSVPRIIANITDSIGVGISIGDNGSTIVVTNSQGGQVSGTTTINAANQLTWTPIPLPVDGSADGQYTVVITPVDKAGRTGTAVQRQFTYDTQAPRITSATPITLHAPISYLGSGLTQFALTVEDVGPADMVFSSQVVALMDATDKPIPAKLTYDELTSQLYLTLDTPFASDGTADGPYTLNVLLIDKAGNRLNTRFNLVYDSIIPQMSSVQVNTAGTHKELTVNQVTELSESIDTIMIKFNEATRVDFENTSVSLLDPNDLPISLTVGDDGVSQMTLSFVALTQIGQYTLSITPQDIAGNAAQNPMQYAFILEFILPDVESVIIGDTITLGSGDTVYVNADNLVIVANLLDPSGTGLSFDTTTGSEIIVATPDGFVVPGSIATNGTDILVWRPSTLSNDGSSDGRYEVYVYSVDKKGRQGVTVYREFIYDTQEPEITNASPINLSQPVSYISESLTQFQFTIQDVGPADLMLEDQVVTLRNQNNVLVPTKLTNDTNNQLFLTLDEPLPLDGSRDGQYTVEIAFSDRAGNVLSINHPIVYDTQAPTLVSTVPADSELLTEDVTQIQVNLDDKGDSGIDWSRTTVTLIDPNGVEISGALSSDGKSQLTLKTNQLVEDGRYVIQVQAIDRAGNGSQSVHESDFLLSRRLPAIVSTVPITAPRDEAYTNEDVEEIEVLLETVDTRHLSTVRLLNADGQVVAGQQHRETGKLIYRLVRPLATDGSEDGDYTIEFTPISSSGRSGAAQSLVFTYDTQSPELDPTTDVHLIVAEQQVDNSLVRIRLDITDNQAGVDWENLETEWVTFERISPDPNDIDGSVLYVSGEPEHLLFTLNVPLADDGSADGKYRITVTPIDKAGNGDETYEKEFTYDTSPPIIDPNSLLINEAPLLTDIDADDYPSAVSTTGGVVIQAVVSDTGLGVNLSQSRIVVSNPNGQELSGITRQNGVDTLVFNSDGLNIEGIYQVTVTATGNDTEQLGITPQGAITTGFLYETTEPTAVVTDDGGKTELTDEALPLVGTATDPEGIRRVGQQGENEIPVPASGVWLVEIVGTGPDGQPIEPVPAEDDRDAQQEPWSRWKVDFLPTRSGDYDLDIRVTDKAGNYAVYDYGEVTMSVSFTFSGNTFVWPSPLRQSNDDVGFFSFELNTSDGTVKLNLYIYDWGGDMVYSKTYDRINPEHRNGNEVSWQLKNSAGNRVARGIYVFRLEAVDGAGNRANAVGKILVVD